MLQQVIMNMIEKKKWNVESLSKEIDSWKKCKKNKKKKQMKILEP